ncbi:MAG: hypothetical protein FWE21_06505 [Defluviitaleaceae bacterium]|nr:hypothetical protein [Defluviitaleaceae bacterium]
MTWDVGQLLWAIERDVSGEAIDIAGYAFVRKDEQYALVSAFTFEEGDLSSIYRFPHSDIFDTAEEAQKALALILDLELEITTGDKRCKTGGGMKCQKILKSQILKSLMC